MRITEIKKQKRGNRANVYLDGRFGFGATANALVDFDLFVNKELSQSEVNVIIKKDQAAKAMQKCFLWLGIRPRSEKELRDKLKEKKFDPQIVNQTIKQIEELGYLNDKEFTRMFIEMKKSKGKIFIQQELRRKGIEQKIIKDALENYYPLEEEIESALRLAERKIKSYKNLPNYKIKQKLAQYLAGRGFNWGVVSQVFEKLKSSR
ncbi:MAG: RecX family transcriptional regulator [Patescibacteria group bacterium]|nr:RecX family transcriptional regulator [Patescibacteria group bacterium]MDD5121212.1 RecX family transcriptional regulator [Patescibacteria group bacterium]MDD5221759.1 RecX family transcriptional regulator [Patescibacteria group bacterium]MDD5395869.1 RecX family transcriptional regulator [Patescibacteria group bacterium]